jgi:hypothetical protein
MEAGAVFRLVVSLQLSFFSVYVKGNVPREKILLNFSYITTKTGGFVSSGSIPVVDLALEQVNNRTDILSNYTLKYTAILDSKVNSNLIPKPHIMFLILHYLVLFIIVVDAIPPCIKAVQSYSIFRCLYGTLQE